MFNVHRKSDSAFMDPLDFMLRRRVRLGATASTSAPTAAPAPQHGRPALLLAPVPATGMRYAIRGERPPSKYGPGESDRVIERFDAYARATGGLRHGR